MNPYAAYQQRSSMQANLENWPRIDLLLTLYDKAIAQLTEGAEALRRKEFQTATSLFARAQFTVAGLAAGVIPDADDVSRNLLRLYEFILHALGEKKLDKIEGALKVLKTLQEGFEAVRSQAIELERSGAIPSVHQANSITVMA